MNYKSLFLTLIFLTLTACGSDNNSNNAGNASPPPVQPPVIQTNKFTTEIPPDLIVLSQGGTGILKAFIVIDDDTQNRIEMQLDINGTGTASVSISGLEQTTHDIKIDYEYLLAEIITPVATANKTLDLTAVGVDDLTFNVNDYDLNRLDDDEDGINNTLELIAGTDPRVIELSAAILNLSYEFENTFTFSWLDVDGATYYNLLEDRGDPANRVQVGPGILQVTQRFDYEVNLLSAHLKSKFILQSCNDLGCSDDKPINVEGSFRSEVAQIITDQYLGAIGDLSGDGNTYAVRTAPEEVSIYIKTNGLWGLQGTVIKRVPNTTSGSENFLGTDTSGDFGLTVVLSKDGNTLVVGTMTDDNEYLGVNPVVSISGSVNESGAVYVFVRNGSDWTEQAYIKSSNIGNSAFFGATLSLSDDGSALVVGAPGDSKSSKGIGAVQSTTVRFFDSGAVYAFKRDDLGVWAQQVYIKASNSDTGDRFGSSVALSSDGLTLAVGAIGEDSASTGIKTSQLIDDNFVFNSGAVYVYVFDGSDWGQEAYIKASNSEAEDGFSVVELSTDGNALVVLVSGKGSGLNNNLTASSVAAVHVFGRDAAVWVQEGIF